MPTEPSGTAIYVPQFRVTFLDTVGVDEAALTQHVTGVEIDENLETPGLFRISLHEELNSSTQKYLWQKYLWLDNLKISPGVRIGLFFGYAQDPKTPLVTGRLKAITPAFLSATVPSMTLECYDFSQDLQKTEKEYNALNVKYSDVAEELARKNSLNPGGVESTRITYRNVVRNQNEKDHALLKRLSDQIGYEFFVRKDTLYFRKPKDDRSPAVSFEYGRNIISFTPRMTTSILVNEVNVVGWDPMTKEKFSETAGIDDIRTSAGFQDMDRFIAQHGAAQ